MYTTQAKIEALFGVTLTAAQIAALSDVTSAVQLFIDDYCGKTFEAVRETRYYDGNGKCDLDIDSFTTASMGVEILNLNGSTQRTLTRGASGDFVTAPYNQTEKYRLQLTPTAAVPTFPRWNRSVRVSALFGGSNSVPADISMAATKLAYQLMRTDTPEGTQLTSVKLGDYQATYAVLSDAAQSLGVISILENHRDIEI